MADSERIFLTFDQAVAFLAPGGSIHTFRNPGGMLLGADWPRAILLDAMRTAKSIEVTGETAQSMRHGLMLLDNIGPLFIETARRTDTVPLLPTHSNSAEGG